ncbi:MAG: hypothetical protein HC820_00495 [Hydrococcus sp. RM1_1_31]|nr:hypothetical protein [Hydrococcus sp. RM1_1_31]
MSSPPLPSLTTYSKLASVLKDAFGVKTTFPVSLSLTLPLTALLTLAIARVSPSGSLSFFKRSAAAIVVAVSCLLVTASLAAMGYRLARREISSVFKARL